MRLSTAIDQYFRHLRAQRRSQDTIDWYAQQFDAYHRWAASSLPAGQADDLPGADMIDAFLAAQHDSGLRPATVNARFRALRALYRWLVKRRKLASADNPIDLLDAPAVPAEVRRYVLPADLDRMLAADSSAGCAWVDARDRLLLFILYYSGLRLGEVAALAVADIDTDQLLIQIRRGKGDKARIVPCHPDLRQLLPAYLLQRPAHLPDLWLASDGYSGHAGTLTAEGIRQLIKRRCHRAGIVPAYNPHAFRHAFAMWTLNAGVRITTVAALMGHADAEITQRVYAHTTAATARREYDQALWDSRKS
jgi:site-specific recombinase XerD